MKLSLENTTWPARGSAQFMRSRDRHGDLSNMTFGFSIHLNGLTFQGPEGLYQAFKFPSDPDVQGQIASQRSGMDAKKTAYRSPRKTVPHWDEIRIDAMALTLALKLQQHPDRFGRALAQTQGLHIVETSYQDQWWGAKPDQAGNLHGINALGRLLTILRDLHQENPATAPRGLEALADSSRLIMNGAPAVLPQA